MLSFKILSWGSDLFILTKSGCSGICQEVLSWIWCNPESDVYVPSSSSFIFLPSPKCLLPQPQDYLFLELTLHFHIAVILLFLLHLEYSFHSFICILILVIPQLPDKCCFPCTSNQTRIQSLLTHHANLCKYRLNV